MRHWDANAARAPLPLLLFGAFDRHNFGDLLFPHIAAALLPGRALIHAGLKARDLRRAGGHRVQALAAFAAHWGGRPIQVLHVGGELLTCDAWQAAVMLQAPRQAAALAARPEDPPAPRLAWARQQLGLPALAPYLLPRGLLPGAAGIAYAGVGGVGLGELAADVRAEVYARLAQATAVGVRDSVTLGALQQAGIRARLMPDPAAMVAELFGDAIAAHGARGEVARVQQRFPRGYLAVQCSADFGDDATLALLAAQLARVARASGCGIVLFRAGAAPWHDDLALYRRLTVRMPQCPTAIFRGRHLWAICALIAGSRGFLGSSLHGRIVAMAHALPRLNFVRDTEAVTRCKQHAYAATWEVPDLPGCVVPDAIAEAADAALAAGPAVLRETAARLAARYRAEFAALGEEAGL